MAASVSAGVTRRHRDDLLWSVERADSTTGVLTAASSRLRQLVTFDAAAWVSTDPATGLPNGPTLLDGVEGVSSAQCSEHWRRELLGEDVNLFTDLAAAPVAAGALRRAVDDPRRSRRYRTFLHPLGFEDELRAVLRTGDTPWGTVTLMRRDGQPAFTSRDTKLLADLSEPLGDALRARAQAASEPLRVTLDQPGLLVFDASGELVSINEQARGWLAEVPPDRALSTDLDVEVPLWLTITVFQASARAAQPGDGVARCRLRTSSGGWLVCHATCLHDGDGMCRQIAVIIEPARPAEIAPIVIEAYDLTGREQQITRLIARGWDRRDRRRAVPVAAHRARPRQGDLPQAGRHQPW